MCGAFLYVFLSILMSSTVIYDKHRLDLSNADSGGLLGEGVEKTPVCFLRYSRP